MDFYYTEREKAADCITYLLRIENEDSEDREKVDACRDTINYLLQNGLEETILKQYDEVSNFEKHLERFVSDISNSKQTARYKSYIVQKKLQEKGKLSFLLVLLLYFV